MTVTTGYNGYPYWQLDLLIFCSGLLLSLLLRARQQVQEKKKPVPHDRKSGSQ